MMDGSCFALGVRRVRRLCQAETAAWKTDARSGDEWYMRRRFLFLDGVEAPYIAGYVCLPRLRVVSNGLKASLSSRLHITRLQASIHQTLKGSIMSEYSILIRYLYQTAYRRRRAPSLIPIRIHAEDIKTKNKLDIRSSILVSLNANWTSKLLPGREDLRCLRLKHKVSATFVMKGLSRTNSHL